jgi:hypothetical protein
MNHGLKAIFSLVRQHVSSLKAECSRLRREER